MHAHPLTPAEFEFIENTLLKYGDDHSVLNLAELDGYFTALVSSPAQVDVAEWFPAIWGGQNPEWNNMDEAQSFLELCVRHINTLARHLAEHSNAFAPRFEQTEHVGHTVTLAEEWCFGYLRGVAIAQWSPLPAIQADLLKTIADCAEQDNFELPQDLDVTAHQQQVAEIQPAALALHDFWSSQR